MANNIITVISVISGILAYWLLYAVPKPIGINQLKDKYDFIIVGGGSAGCVVATRLSEDPGVTVLLLEAGKMDTDYWSARIPGMLINLQESSADWKYQTTPLKSAGNALIEKKSRWPRGKVLGGSSVLNFMHHIRGSPKEFDEWESMGNKGWAYKDVLPYFKKSEGMTIPHLKSSHYHNTNGPLAISYGLRSKFDKLFKEIVLNSGETFNEDPNGEDLEGWTFMQTTTIKGVRASTAEVFIRPVMKRPNLHVLTGAHASRIHFDNSNVAKAVEFTVSKQRYICKATQEVVISAGAINSPQLLIWSGIGPKSEVKKAKVPVIYENSNVGKNLEEHVCTIFVFDLNTTIGLQPNDSPMRFAEELIKYYAVRESSQFSYVSTGIDGFFRSEINSGLPYPDIQVTIVSANVFDKALADKFGFKSEVYMESQRQMPNMKTQISGLVVNLHPHTRGSITLNASQPFVAPIIDYQYFDHEMDLDVIVRGFHRTLKILNDPKMMQHGMKLSAMHFPACRNFKELSTEHIKCMAKQLPISVYHPTSTCRMGNSPKDAVVDSELRYPKLESNNTKWTLVFTSLLVILCLAFLVILSVAVVIYWKIKAVIPVTSMTNLPLHYANKVPAIEEPQAGLEQYSTIDLD